MRRYWPSGFAAQQLNEPPQGWGLIVPPPHSDEVGMSRRTREIAINAAAHAQMMPE
jgi:hypothetical protein